MSAFFLSVENIALALPEARFCFQAERTPMAKRKSRKQSNTMIVHRFGFQLDDIHAAAKIIRPLLRIRWKRHSAEFWGGDYYMQTRKNGIVIKLHHNYEDYFEHWLQPNYKDYPLLLLMQYPPGTKAPDRDELLETFNSVTNAVYIPPNSDALNNVE
ncbi:MAG: hypothetical protein KC547_11600 [Anaerolineae bacterium]|nr:hypothetical protein [Anaerolineae bacterium]